MKEVQMVYLLHLAGAAVFLDLKYQRIPNELLMTGFVGGLFYQIYYFQWSGLISFLTGIFVPVILLGSLFYFRMIGAGDVKLLCVVGGFSGPYICFLCIIYTILFGGAIAALLIIKRRNLFSRLFYFKVYVTRLLETKKWSPYIRTEDRDSHFCFSIPVFLSLLCYLGGVY